MGGEKKRKITQSEKMQKKQQKKKTTHKTHTTLTAPHTPALHMAQLLTLVKHGCIAYASHAGRAHVGDAAVLAGSGKGTAAPRGHQAMGVPNRESAAFVPVLSPSLPPSPGMGLSGSALAQWWCAVNEVWMCPHPTVGGNSLKNREMSP